MRTLTAITFIIVTIIIISGCGQDAAPGKVKGTITLDGEPLPNASVAFCPESNSGALSSFGGTNASGQYELFYANKKTGAIPGRYKVTVHTGNADMGRAELVPAMYRSPETTDLVCDVKKGTNTFDIQLVTPPAGSEPPQPSRNKFSKKPSPR
jgi:hypothetical protein